MDEARLVAIIDSYVVQTVTGRRRVMRRNENARVYEICGRNFIVSFPGGGLRAVIYQDVVLYDVWYTDESTPFARGDENEWTFERVLKLTLHAITDPISEAVVQELWRERRPR